MPPENGSDIQQKVEYVKKSLPTEMAKAADTFPPEEFLQRVEIYRDLQKAYDTLEKNSKRLTSMKDTYLAPLREIQNMQHWVATSAKGDFARSVTTKFEGWEGNDINFNYTGTDTVSIGELIARYSKNSKRVGEFLGGTPDQVGKEKDTEGYDRIATFIDALETRSDDAEISAAIAKYRTRVGGTLVHTKKLLGDLEKIIVEKRNSDAGTLRFDVIKASDANLASALRVIGDTANSGVVATRKMKRQSDGETSGDDAEDANYKKLGEFYQKNYDGFKKSAQQDAQKQFDEILKSLEGYPQYLEYQNKKTEIIASITEQNIFMKATDKYISTYGGEKLGAIGKLYDDMKGLYGAFNFTDENVVMTKELAITFVSMALSFGTAGILLGVAKVAGGVRAALATKNLATVTENASRMRKAVTLAKNAGTGSGNVVKYIPRKVATATEITLKGAAGAVRAVESGGTIVRTAGEALKFTTAQTVLEAYGPLAQGDGAKRVSLESFAKRFAQNAIMFGTFAGVEKFLSGPLIAKLGISAQKGIITQKNIVLSAGDVSALYLLHGLETGDFELTPNMIAMTVAFRTAPGMAEKFAQAFPKLNTKLASYKSSVPEGITLSQEDYAIALTKVPQHFRDQIGAEAYIRMIEKVAGLSNPERILEAERILRRSLNQEEKDALILAHNTGEGSIFQWSTGDLKAKLEILQYGKRRAELPKKQRPEKELFTQEERAKLMESGLTGKAEKMELQRPVDEIITAKGSIYRYLPDGRIQRFKTKTGELQTPQDAIVFIPDYATIERMAPKSFNMEATLGENGTQMEQILLTRLHDADSKIYIVNSKGEKLETNRAIQAEPGEIYLSIGPNETKVDFIIPVSKDPKVGYQTYDTRTYRDPSDPKQRKRERHIGNKIIEIKYKPEAIVDIVAAREQLATLNQELITRQAIIRQYTRKSTSEFVENQAAIGRIQKEIQDLEGSIARAEKGASPDKGKVVQTVEDDLASMLRLESSDPLRESLRTKIHDLMKLNDAAFEKSFRDAEAQGWGGSKYEKEIYNATKEVRSQKPENLTQFNDQLKQASAELLKLKNKPTTPKGEQKLQHRPTILFARIASEYRLKNTPRDVSRDVSVAVNHNQFPTIIRDGTNTLKIVTPEGPIALPKGTQVLPPEAAKNPTDWTRKAWGLGGLLLIGGILYACSGDDKNKMLTPVSLTNPTTPIAAPVTPEEACRDIGTKVSEINIRRDNGRGDILTTQTREIITKRFMGSREFQTFQTFLNDHNADIQSKTACNDILEFLKPPTVANIQELQRRINMNASDDKNGQDGILGPITLKQLQKYLETELAK
ncbi:MAG: hypothetical protein U0518_03365 [Candidatus Gracilibacteria bacterium]